MFSVLSIFWTVISSGWGSRLATAREAVKRFGNGQAAMAVVATIVVVTVAIGIGLAAWHVTHEAAAARDAYWRQKIGFAEARAAALEIERDLDRQAAEAAHAERAALAGQATAQAERASDLEAELAALRAASPGAAVPVVFPKDLARKLNR